MPESNRLGARSTPYNLNTDASNGKSRWVSTKNLRRPHTHDRHRELQRHHRNRRRRRLFIQGTPDRKIWSEPLSTAKPARSFGNSNSIRCICAAFGGEEEIYSFSCVLFSVDFSWMAVHMQQMGVCTPIVLRRFYCQKLLFSGQAFPHKLRCLRRLRWWRQSFSVPVMGTPAFVSSSYSPSGTFHSIRPVLRLRR